MRHVKDTFGNVYEVLVQARAALTELEKQA